ncbi:MAG: hypothetical protein HYX42_13625 [Polaromonas sp.]|uniref:hypothetical protein n=1 Tax=Polaromonas sp. TaxID=1869339 RepID=UPI0025E094C3|nr:hypothetical protein [Polaromonas sp.]MBI2727278.1 hypothetical protein [Polaromonas sp.]
MLHPLFSTVIQRPDLVADHASAYAALFNQEVKAMGTNFVERVAVWVLVVLCGFLFLSLTGIALMLGFIHNQFHWTLVAVPGFALILTMLAFLKTRQPLPQENFTELKAQLDSDIHALRMAA